MVKIQVITGSTRPTRVGPQIAEWVYEVAKKRTDLEAELVDIADYNLPLLDEPETADTGIYTKDHTKKWSAKINEADGYIFVVPEYNHGMSAPIKNAIDFLYKEWNNKAAAFVSYGKSVDGARSVEQLRQVAAAIQIADIRAHVTLDLAEVVENGTFKPTERHEGRLNNQLDQLVSWSKAMKTVRQNG